MPYIGNTPAERFTSFDYQDLTGGSGTSFTLDNTVGNPQEIEVFVNNVRQEPGVAYTVSGTTLTMTGSVASTDDFYVVFQGKAIQTATHPSDRALTATDGTFTGDLTVDTNTLFVDSTNNEVGIGTLTPGGSLEVYKAGTSEVLIGTDNGGTAQLSLYENNDGTKEGLLKYDGTNNRIHLATSSAANALVIPRDSGNIGMGTNSPSHPLEVRKDNPGSGVLALFGSNGTQYTGKVSAISNSVTIGRSRINVPASTTTQLVNGYGGSVVLLAVLPDTGVADIQYTFLVTHGWNAATVLFTNTYGGNTATFTFAASSGNLTVNHNHSGAVNINVQTLVGPAPGTG